ncbi:hypothetical protein [Cyclobacterium marinum]|uniref:Uncharacterized protein n=1 Tax=Cyclobacterium marinum (strain ATCC 25205 / DSM 745 / LMG 13164 / NCIMB 1802) TaxID=880070 RepID=G0J881_CYCMS|nr:hypothetical protein [Cyclobacterium marinum]AEL27861.1 hypothetical protein Cycma_4157 [Cyclobacterium marinum DSM 745]
MLKFCEFWAIFDFDLSSGKIDYIKTYEHCDSEEQINKKEEEGFYYMNLKINLSNRNFRETKIITPKYRHELFL